MQPVYSIFSQATMTTAFHFTKRLAQVCVRQSLSRGFQTSSIAAMPIKVGDKLPDVTLFENKPDESVKTSELFGKGKHVLVGIVGAFTGTCQNDHFPTFVDNIDKIKAKGVEIVACVSVNDPFVTAAFGTAMNADGKIRMLADTCGTFTEKIDLEWDVAAAFGTKRSQRYVMVINDGVVTGLNVEEDSSKVKCTSGTDILSLL